MKNAHIAASTLGIYAGLLGAAHGYNEIMQGNVTPDGIMISAIGPPCQPEAVAHACWPAMTVVPNFLVTGILAVVLGLITAIWAAGFVYRRVGGPVLILLSILMLLVGGGFIPVFVGVIAGVAAVGIHASLPKWCARLPKNGVRFGSALWPWPLVAYLAWAFIAQSLLDRFFHTFLLNAGLILFFFFDLGLPLLVALTGFARDILKMERSSI
jgi:hypothetical protein